MRRSGTQRDPLPSSVIVSPTKWTRRTRREALREIALDVEEGADIVMVKPALPYLDVIAAARAQTSLPVAAYQVSGEYSMIKAAGKAGWWTNRGPCWNRFWPSSGPVQTSF